MKFLDTYEFELLNYRQLQVWLKNLRHSPQGLLSEVKLTSSASVLLNEIRRIVRAMYRDLAR